MLKNSKSMTFTFQFQYNSAGPQVRFLEESFAWSKFQSSQFDRIILNNIKTVMCRVLSLLILIYF